MKSWTSRIQKFYKKNYSDGDCVLNLGSPSLDEELEHLRHYFEIDIPQDLFELYQEHNGFGIISSNQTEWWLLVPISNLVEFRPSSIDWFSKTHPSLASRVFPFWSWGSGDFLCLVQSECKSFFLSDVHEFSHENYLFEEDQKWPEFLINTKASIHDFISEVR